MVNTGKDQFWLSVIHTVKMITSKTNAIKRVENKLAVNLNLIPNVTAIMTGHANV